MTSAQPPLAGDFVFYLQQKELDTLPLEDVKMETMALGHNNDTNDMPDGISKNAQFARAFSLCRLPLKSAPLSYDQRLSDGMRDGS